MTIDINPHAEGIGQVRVVTVTLPQGRQRQAAFAQGELFDWQTVVLRFEHWGIDLREPSRDQSWWRRQVARAIG